MLIGISKEIKDNENRVGIIPSTVKTLTQNGHHVLIETNAGVGSSISDADYVLAGATIVLTAKEAWAAELVVKSTGSGKTILACEMIRLALGKAKRALFIAHRKEIKSNARNHKTIVFASSVAHSKNIVIAFTEAGISARHLDATTSASGKAACFSDWDFL